MDDPFTEAACPEYQPEWIEFLSNQFHYHQKKTGLGLAEADFLPIVKTGDTHSPLPWKKKFPYIVGLDRLRSAFNVGSIIRTVDAVGFESVLMSEPTPGKEHNQVKKAAMGSSDWIPSHKTPDLVRSLTNYKKKNYSLIAVETVVNSYSYLDYPWPGKGVIVLGNEEYGVSLDVLRVCDDFVHIPMFGRKNSINVANAFSVIAFHIRSSLSSRKKKPLRSLSALSQSAPT